MNTFPQRGAEFFQPAYLLVLEDKVFSPCLSSPGQLYVSEKLKLRSSWHCKLLSSRICASNPGVIIALSPCNRHPCFSDVDAKEQQFIQKEGKQCRIHLDLLYIIMLFALKMKGAWGFVAGSGGFSSKGIQSKFLGLEEVFIALEWTVHEDFIPAMACRKKKKKIQILFLLVFPPYLLSVHAYFPLGYKYFPKCLLSGAVMLGQPCALIPVSKKSVFLLLQEKQAIKLTALDIGVNAFIPEWK